MELYFSDLMVFRGDPKIALYRSIFLADKYRQIVAEIYSTYDEKKMATVVVIEFRPYEYFAK